jgi:hypothetical protein
MGVRYFYVMGAIVVMRGTVLAILARRMVVISKALVAKADAVVYQPDRPLWPYHGRSSEDLSETACTLFPPDAAASAGWQPAVKALGCVAMGSRLVLRRKFSSATRAVANASVTTHSSGSDALFANGQPPHDPRRACPKRPTCDVAG